MPCRRGPGGSLTMKRIAASLLAVGLLAAPVLAAETTPPARPRRPRLRAGARLALAPRSPPARRLARHALRRSVLLDRDQRTQRRRAGARSRGPHRVSLEVLLSAL